MTGMYDLHTHTTMSDGEMLPMELIRRMAVLGYDTVAVTDHADSSNLESLLAALPEVRESANIYGVRLLCGVELTHVPPTLIQGMAQKAKNLGADVVVVHGETLMEPVAPGTNRAACSCTDVDVLAHPGLITMDDAMLAAEHGVALELTSRGGHNRTNGHVANMARDAGCTLVVNSDAHAPHDLLDERAKFSVAMGAGLKKDECSRAVSLNIDKLVLR